MDPKNLKKLKLRAKKIAIYATIVEQISQLSSATTKKVGCMALRNDFSKIASFGYNGSYKGAGINPETGTEEDSLEPGCSGFIHAEINMIAKFQERDPENYIIFLTLSPCKMCAKVLINSGFKHIYWIEDYRNQDHLDMFDNTGITYGTMDKLVHDIKLFT
jgi:dCMP deaminase